ncbi:hypothetical protein PI124_g20657 [Phytophthora idaei]|nr:hypothetical protein PI125_g21836 [Phytophthora idaei]KAG3234290.1 hypothetical protein PI124_g20657 [Phytophthora idaei]
MCMSSEFRASREVEIVEVLVVTLNPPQILEKSDIQAIPKTPRRHGVSKNCANTKKQQLSAKRRRIKEELEKARRLQDQIRELGRRSHALQRAGCSRAKMYKPQL